ncbi:hypothetical protein [Streptomyces sp. NPDC051132]|uniref:hypothetical protein n=1 Tax=unclassified Streptomyces TaxID=2593676 RepID=UPI00341F4D3D
MTKAPALAGGKVKAQLANARGNRVLEIRGGIQAGPLSAIVACQGKGRVTVFVRPVGLSFPLECVRDEVSSTQNRIDLKRARGDGTVSVTASSGVRWALTVGQ